MEQDKNNRGERLSVREKLGFGVFDLGGNMMFSVMGFWCLHYLTDIAGLTAALAGFALMIGKVWDAVTDPAMGLISDRTKTPLGRRRPYLLAGAIPMGLSFWFFFTVPNISSQAALAAWAALALILFNTFSTVLNVPYSSLTPELTADYHEQTSLNGFRFGFAVFGTIIGAAAIQPLAGLFSSPRQGYSMTGLILGGIVTVTSLLTFFGTKEKKPAGTDLPPEKFLKTYQAVFTNRPFIILVTTYMLHLTALTLLQGIIIYYTKYIYNNEAIATPAMALLLVVAMVFIPVSVLTAKKIGKRAVYQICFIILSIATVAIFFLGHALGIRFFFAVMVFAGIGVGFNYVAPFAMVPDTIAYDELRTGSRREGSYYGIWTFFSKIGSSLALLLSGLILQAGGYIADAVQSESALFAIRLIIGPVPAAIFICAAFLMRLYPLDEKACRKMAEEKILPSMSLRAASREVSGT
ncbi:MAG: MFS transporter [Treponema sp.]|jgi:GPH family glycoside/pentoside/hexuronide:cation symporter|nr:MFS transporter [Treponema sp.]